ncbi:MAG: FG-GAP-like repeat-containing protein [Candidatus Eisenbacteria bacterium]
MSRSCRTDIWVHGQIITARSQTNGVALWSRSLLSALGQPLAIANGSQPRVYVTTASGFVFALDPATGATLWSRDLKRAVCASDQLTRTVVVQHVAASDSVFRAVFTSDVLFVATRHGCSSTTSNRVFALDTETGAIRWTHNPTGTFLEDDFSALALDVATNRLFGVMTKLNETLSQNTVVCLNSVTGSRQWSRDLGAIDAAPMMLGGSLFVVSRAGVLYKLDAAAGGATVWSTTVATSGAAVSLDMAGAIVDGVPTIYLTDTAGFLTYVRDLGASASTPESARPLGRNAVSAPLVHRPVNRLFVGLMAPPGLAQVSLCTPTIALATADELPSPAQGLACDVEAGAFPRLLTSYGGPFLREWCVPWPLTSNQDCTVLPPAVDLTRPVGTEVVRLGLVTPIHWTSGSDAGVQLVDLDLSTTGVNGPYAVIATGIANDGSHDWLVTGPASENAFVRIRAHSADGFVGVDVSDSAFAIRDLVPETARLISPASVDLVAGASTPVITGRVLVAGVTEALGAGGGITAEVGFGPHGSDPAVDLTWAWSAASYDSTFDGTDQFLGTLTPTVAGDFDYAYRFSYAGGPWSYADLDGSESGYSVLQAGRMLVHAPVVSWFVDATAASGTGLSGNCLGAAWPDVDGDGDPDLSVTRFGASNALFTNALGVFTDVSATSGIGFSASSTGGAWADLDNDLDLDLFVVTSIEGHRLLRNDAGHWTDASTGSGAQGPSGGQALAWADYDRDGDVDLYVSNHEAPGSLYRNGGGGHFTDVTLAAGLGGSGKGRSAAWADYDDDGDADLFVTFETEPNRLYRNLGAGVFLECAAASGISGAGAHRGAAWGDADGDGDLDLLVAVQGAPKFYRNLGGGTFEEQAGSQGLSALADTRSVHWVDFDHDGDLDAFFVNGGPDGLFANDGAGLFSDVSALSGLDAGGAGNTAAWADADGDGDLDVYIAEESGGRFLQNQGPFTGHWLRVALTSSNDGAIGARVRAVAGSRVFVREISGGASRSSQDALVADLGLGSATSLDSLIVRWPDGRVQAIEPPPALDQQLHLTEPPPIAGVPGSSPSAIAVVRPRPNPSFGAVRIEYLLSRAARVQLSVYTPEGRLVRAYPESRQEPGPAIAHWDGRDELGRDVSSGMYFYRLTIGTEVLRGRMTVLR